MFSFRNIGNSCYLNSALQCLMRLPMLNASFDDAELAVKDPTPAQMFVKEYDDLRVMALSNPNCVISPALFRHSMQLYAKIKKNDNFSGCLQNDAAEFIQFMLDAIHEALAKKENFDTIPVQSDIERKCVDMMKKTFGEKFSDVVHLFYGIHLSYIKDNCSQEAFMTLDLPIPETATNLVDCIRAYMADETITDWMDEKTKVRETVVKSFRFFRLPTILFVCLKRFSADGRKNEQTIDIPLEFTFDNVVYQYRCGCLHSGQLDHGHYTAVAEIQGTWTVLDDNEHYPATSISKNAYCMFYVKKDA